MKKILCLFPRFSIGGIAKALCFVANTCAKNNMDVCCISMSNEEKLLNFENNIRTEVIDYKTDGNRVESIKNKILFLIKFRKKILEEKPDVIISFGTDLVRISTIAAYGTNIKIIGSERGNPSLYSKKQFKKYSKALKKCDKVVFQTKAAQQFYSDTIKSKSIIIPNACISRSTNRNFKNEISKTIVSCGRLSSEKNFEGLIRAFYKTHKELEDYKLHIYGNGPEYNRLQKIINELKDNRIRLCGQVQDVFEKENNCSLFVLNSLTDGMPNALIEAMLEGIPCIATDCPPGGVRFISDNGRRVLLVPVNNEEALAKAMIKVIKDSNLKRNLINNAYEIRNELDPNKIGRKWISVVQEVT
ncbi:hypothetical protein B5E77_03900 [Lachnoclostridium sp. An131]|uniref:glycosyltransferase n=1 Tax=Lachnoclostridium sp. An131 TaxID=1965555 RepID=UPI000B38CF51|nr:glycosyltransferase [Lachnoclostridium sp. An131]OUQ27969.1 hypothetical protein B5E77_03900 [Lachnoclostridium sp. An131]